jgi:hypothetical protein
MLRLRVRVVDLPIVSCDASSKSTTIYIGVRIVALHYAASWRFAETI